jgi:hypothetical protein
MHVALIDPVELGQVKPLEPPKPFSRSEKDTKKREKDSTTFVKAELERSLCVRFIKRTGIKERFSQYLRNSPHGSKFKFLSPVFICCTVHILLALQSKFSLFVVR